MKALALVSLSALFSTALVAGDGYITTAERAKAVKLIEDTRVEFLQAVEKLSDAQWKYKPAPDRWSVGEVAEHIVLTEGVLFGMVEKALANKPNPDWESKTAGKDELVERLLPDRSRKAEAPQSVRPAAKLTRAEIISRYKEARAKTLKFAEETGQPLRAHTQDHVFPVFGTLNAYQWLIYVPLHNLRHNKQIAEVKADAGFPKE